MVLAEPATAPPRRMDSQGAVLHERVRPVSPVADDDVIVQREPDHSRRLGEPRRDLAILAGRGRERGRQHSWEPTVFKGRPSR